MKHQAVILIIVIPITVYLLWHIYLCLLNTRPVYSLYLTTYENTVCIIIRGQFKYKPPLWRVLVLHFDYDRRRFLGDKSNLATFPVTNSIWVENKPKKSDDDKMNPLEISILFVTGQTRGFSFSSGTRWRISRLARFARTVTDWTSTGPVAAVFVQCRIRQAGLQ